MKMETAYNLSRIRYSEIWYEYSKSGANITLDTAPREQNYKLAAVHAIEHSMLYEQKSQGIPKVDRH